MNTLPAVRWLLTISYENAIIVNIVVVRGRQINIISPYIRCYCGFVNIVLYYFKINIGSRFKLYYGFKIHFATSLTNKYSTWKKEMQIWEMATCVEKVKRALIMFLSLEGKAREAVLELDIAVLNSKDGMEKVYEKLDTLFLEA